jgi:VanZ family protein
MLPLRHVRLWQVLSIALVVFVLVAAVTPVFWFFDSKAKAISWFQNVDKWLHASTFLVLSVWFAGLFARRNYWLVVAGLLMFGGLLELLQYQIGYRTADWFDMGANTVGIILGLSVSVAGLGGWGLRLEDWYSRRKQL